MLARKICTYKSPNNGLSYGIRAIFASKTALSCFASSLHPLGLSRPLQALAAYRKAGAKYLNTPQSVALRPSKAVLTRLAAFFECFALLRLLSSWSLWFVSYRFPELSPWVHSSSSRFLCLGFRGIKPLHVTRQSRHFVCVTRQSFHFLFHVPITTKLCSQSADALSHHSFKPLLNCHYPNTAKNSVKRELF